MVAGNTNRERLLPVQRRSERRVLYPITSGPAGRFPTDGQIWILVSRKRIRVVHEQIHVARGLVVSNDQSHVRRTARRASCRRDTRDDWTVAVDLRFDVIWRQSTTHMACP